MSVSDINLSLHKVDPAYCIGTGQQNRTCVSVSVDGCTYKQTMLIVVEGFMDKPKFNSGCSDNSFVQCPLGVSVLDPL